MRLVVDTNVLVSAVLRGRGPASAIDWVVDHADVAWLTSDAIVDEYRRVLGYRRLGLSQATQRRWLRLIERRCVRIVPQDPMAFPPDPDDAKFLACALSGDARYLITGDGPLLRLGHLGPVEVIGVRGFLERIGVS